MFIFVTLLYYDANVNKINLQNKYFVNFFTICLKNTNTQKPKIMKKRYKMLIAYMITHNYAQTQKELANVLGYKNPTTLSQIINGKIETSDKFLGKLKDVAPELNLDWLKTGEGEMLLKSGQNVTVSGNSNITQQNKNGNNHVGSDDRLLSIIEEQSHQLTTSQEQITQLITIIKEKL